MNCLCCGKPLNKGDDSAWHEKCIRDFFGTSKLPVLSFRDEEFNKVVIESTNKGFTVPGVQKKISMHLFSEGGKPRLTLVNYPTGYILKPQVEDYQALPEAEHLIMSMADKAGIRTVPHALIPTENGLAYITKRIDRIFTKSNFKMLAMEDFCQLDLRLTQDKYRGSYERCAKVIEKYSSRSGLDMTELYMRLVFSFIVGNSDMHLKNFSLIETEEASECYVLSPAYDLLPVNIILPEDKEEFALTLNAKKMNIRRNDFYRFASLAGISRVSAEKMLINLISMKDSFIKMSENSNLPESLKEKLISLIQERIKILGSDH